MDSLLANIKESLNPRIASRVFWEGRKGRKEDGSLRILTKI